MRVYSWALVCFACLFLDSCSNEQEVLEKKALKYATTYFNYPSETTVSVHSSPSGEPHMYNGFITLEAYGEAVDFPIILSYRGLKKQIKMVLTNDEMEVLANDFSQRVQTIILSSQSGTTRDNPKQDALPEWVYGTWSCTTSYGTETIRIEEGGIWRLSYGHSDYGSYTYSDGVIRAKFPKDSGITTSLPLDISNRRIEYGEGYYWHKR